MTTVQPPDHPTMNPSSNQLTQRPTHRPTNQQSWFNNPYVDDLVHTPYHPRTEGEDGGGAYYLKTH